MSSNFKLQAFVHKLEEKKMASAIKLLALGFLGLAVLLVVVFDPMGWNFFRGLSSEKGMEQAQIARELAAGNGYSTKMIRPMAAQQIMEHLEKKGDGVEREEVARRLEKDTYHAPLWSVVLAPVMKVMQGSWEIDVKKSIYALDKAIAVTAILLFYGAVIVNFFTLRRLFDVKLAMVASGVQLLTYSFWQYAMSGLPQMLMLFIFSVIIWALVRALVDNDERKSVTRWVALMAIGAGLLVMTHYIAVWPMLGLMAFVIIYFPGRFKNGLLMTLGIAIMLLPWLYRNYQLTGSFSGMAGLTLLNQVSGSEDVIMRQISDEKLWINFSSFRSKLQENLTANVGNAFQHLGGWLAPFFFLTLLYPFRRTAIRNLRWALLLMWLVAVFGMSLFQAQDITSGLNSSNLNLLFIPFFAAYGVAFIFTLWGGLSIRQKFFQTALTCLILFLAGLPLINALLNKSHPVWWPPYLPPLMSYLQKWTTADEVLLSDMPWAVAWYSDRRSMWIPNSPKSFLDVYDYNRLGYQYSGMYLSPLTLGAGFMTELVRGKYKDWAPLILPALQDKANPAFPFSKMIAFGPQGLCMFFSDTERWSSAEAADLKKSKEDDTDDASKESKEEEGQQ